MRTSHTTRRAHRSAAGIVGGLALAAVLAGAPACGGDGSDGDQTARQAEVAERGADVMPFDLDATTHHFEPTAAGLVQTVLADDPGDEDQIALIRDHLAGEAARFRRGDYGDPARIHGEAMPGLAELESNAAAITIVLEDVAGGARLTFTATDPTLVEALHDWGEAQVADHGQHAEGG